jgi:tight adherence protein B
MLDALEPLLAHPMAIPVIIGLAVAGIAYAVLYPMLSGEAEAEKRQSRFIKTDRRTTGRLNDVAAKKKQVSETLKELDAREKGRNKFTFNQKLEQAGLKISRERYFLIFAVLGPVLGAVTYFGSGHLLSSIGMLIFGTIGAPFFVLSFLLKRRIKKFVNEFPNAVDVIVRGVKAGLPLGDCLRIIASEAAEPVRSEFRYLVDQQQLGLTMAEACNLLYQRVPTQEANFFGIVIEIQQKAGGNLSEVLTNLSKVLRDRKKMKGKIIAMSQEAKASAAIIGCLPFAVGIMTYITSPAYISLLWQTNAGVSGMIGGGIWMVMGILVMKKMINFDF